MAAGLQVFNSSGVLQIDSTYRNARLSAKGSLATNLAWIGNSLYGAITLASATPIVAWRSNGPAIVLTSGNGSTCTYYFIAKSVVSVEYWLFDVTTPPTTANVGLQVFNPAGQLVFDSGDKAAKVLEILNVSGAGSYTYPGKRVAVVQNMVPLTVSYLGAPGGYSQFISGIMCSTPADGQVDVTGDLIASQTVAVAGPTIVTSNASYVVMDVTGI